MNDIVNAIRSAIHDGDYRAINDLLAHASKEVRDLINDVMKITR